MRDEINLKVHLAFDPEVGIWYVAESDIPGLRLEAEDPMELIRRVADAAPELIELNGREIIEQDGSRRRGTIGFTPIFDDFLPVAASA